MSDDPNLDSIQDVIALAQDALHRRDKVNSRKFAFKAARLDPKDERPWLILAAIAAPKASIFYLHKALELNPKSEAAKKGLVWAIERLPKSSETPAMPVINELKPVGSKLESLPGPKEKDETNQPTKKNHSSTFSRVAKYGLVRGLGLFASVVASIFLIVYIANLGGYLDTIQKGLISEDISNMLRGGWLRYKPPAERQAIIDQTRASMEAFYGLDQPYVLRSINWMYRGITFDWGKSRFPYVVSTIFVEGAAAHDITSDDIRTLIFTYLPRTVLLLGVSNIGLFLVSILIALPLVRRPSKWANRLVMWLAPTSSIPSWLIGVVMLSIIYRVTKNYSFQLGFSEWSSAFDINFLPAILKGMLLPFLAIILSKFFQSVYSWRNYFMIYSREDYVDLAKAKGLPDNLLQNRYMLRPALPSIITTFALIMISIWQECIALEYFFNIGGIGAFFMSALNNNDISVVVALTATFAYFLAITVFILDIIYALIDPRVKIGNNQQSEKPIRGNLRFNLSLDLFKKDRYSARPRRSSIQNVSLPWTEKIKIWFIGQYISSKHRLSRAGHSILDSVKEIKRYPTAVTGILIIAVLAIISICTVIVIPYSKAIALWRGDNKAWIRNPKFAPPVWVNYFRKEKLPENIDVNSKSLTSNKVLTTNPDGTRRVSFSLPFDYSYKTLPQDVLVLFNPVFKSERPFIHMTWITPDGREIPVSPFTTGQDSIYFISQDKHIFSKLNENSKIQAFFSKPDGPPGEILQGRYQLKIDCILFEEKSDFDAEVVVYGQVYGLAGTDMSRRDLSLILLWGLAVALSFGILAAVSTTICSVTLAALGVWFGGWIDGMIQRISEINMVLPLLPTCIMIFFLYSKSFWVILGVTIGLSIFGNSIKNYRAMFLQVVELPYIEAAASYGATDWRIIFHYMIPRIRNVFIPQIIILVPSYIFFETTLTFLGVSDPVLPTLGKLLYSIVDRGIFNLPAYIPIEASTMLLLISIGFVLLGFGLEKSYNDKAGI
jgi:peptide/nickel transport system permease protein